MSKRKNEGIIRKMILDEIGLPPNSPEYKAAWARIDRRIENLPEELYREFDSQIEGLRKDIRMLVKYTM